MNSLQNNPSNYDNIAVIVSTVIIPSDVSLVL